MSSILSNRPPSRSNSRPRPSSKRHSEGAGKASPPPVTSGRSLGTTYHRRSSLSTYGRNQDTTPTKTHNIGTNESKGDTPLSQPPKSTEPAVPTSNPKPSTITNQSPVSENKAVAANPSASLSPPTTVPKSAFSTNSSGPISKPVDSKPKVSVPTAKQQSAPHSAKNLIPPRSDNQKTSAPQLSKTKPIVDHKLPRSLSKSGKSQSLISSPSSPPIDKDIPNLPADRPVKGIDPVFAVAEMKNEEIPVKNVNEISMSTRKEICANTGGAIGNTPLVMLNSIGKGLPGKIAVKLEYMNPAGSVKDRVGYSMIDDAEKRGLIEPGKTVLIEPTSGNMGIALAFVARIKGYKLILTMPASMSVERRSLLKAYGAEVVLTDPATAVKGALQRAKELQAAIPNSHILNQFGNPANVKAHYNTTGPEVWEQTNGKVDIVCYGVGSGGTLSGVGKYLKEKKPSVEVFPVEPFESSVINGFAHSPHKIQGMGTGFIPDILDKTLFSEALRVHSDDAIAMAKRLATEEAILGGISSGANVCAAVQLASRPENEGKLIVTNINSFGERYLSTTLYSEIRDAAEKMKMMSLDESLDIAQKYVANE